MLDMTFGLATLVATPTVGIMYHSIQNVTRVSGTFRMLNEVSDHSVDYATII